MKLWSVLAWLLLASCSSPPKKGEIVRRSQPLLGTFVTITVCGSNREHLHEAVSRAFEEFKRVDRLASIHRADSELSRVNARAAARPMPVSEELFTILQSAQEIAEQTEGSLDVTIRPLADLWGFIWKEYRFPTQAELAGTLPRVNYRFVQLNPAHRTVHFLNEGISIDLGGIAKGYAVDCAMEKLQSLGVTNALVKAGGDLRAKGAPPGENSWTIQLEDPQKKGNRTSLRLRDAALSTSGNYENFFELGGKRYAHILDPRTGLPVEDVAACTVIGPSCMMTDALATACFVLGKEASFQKFGGRYGLQFTFRPLNPAGKWPTFSNALFPPLFKR